MYMELVGLGWAGYIKHAWIRLTWKECHGRLNKKQTPE